MKRLIFTFFVAIALSTSGCTLDDSEPNFHFSPLRILSADMPDFFELNQSYEITVMYQLPDACTGFRGFEVSQSDLTTRNVVVFGTVQTDGQACPQVVKEAEASFTFNCQYDEPYLFRFWQGEDANGDQQYLEIEVPVN